MISFKDLLESNKLETTAKEYYDQHTAKGLPNYEVLTKKLNVDPSLLKDKDQKNFKSFFDKSNSKNYPEYVQREAEKEIDNAINVINMDYFEQDDPIMDYIRKELDLKYAYMNCNTQPPGQVVQNHIDRNRSFIYKVVPNGNVSVDQCWKYIVFLTDWEPGQVFMVGGSAYMNWQSGQTIKFPWFMHHATANAGWNDRKILVVTGMPNALA